MCSRPKAPAPAPQPPPPVPTISPKLGGDDTESEFRKMKRAGKARLQIPLTGGSGGGSGLGIPV